MRLRILVAVAVLLVVPGTLAATARAQVPAIDCGATLTDGDRFVTDQGSFSTAADLVALHGTPQVVAMAATPGGDIDAWFDDELPAACPDWFVEGSLLTPDRIVVAVAVGDRQTLIRYGDRWRPILDDRWLAIQQDAMAPSFAAGDIGGGLTAGLVAIARAADPALDQALDGVPPAIGRDRPAPVDVPRPSAPSGGDDDADLTATLGVLGGLAGATAVGGAGWWAVQRRRRLDEARGAVAARLAPARDAFLATDERWRAEGEAYDRVLATLEGDTARRLESERAAAEASVEALRAAYRPVADVDDVDPSQRDLAGCAALGRSLDALASAQIGADAAVARAMSAQRGVERQRTDLAAEHRRQEGLIADAHAAGRALAADGWRVEAAIARLDELTTRLAGMGVGRERLDVDAVIADLDLLVDESSETRFWIADLPHRRDRLVARAEAARALIDENRARFPGAEAEVAGWSDVHAEGSWSEVADHPADAAAALDRAEAQLAPITDADGPLSMARQEWDDAAVALAECMAEIEQADALLDDVDELGVALLDAHDRAALARDAARAALAELEDYVTANDPALDEVYDSAPEVVAALLAVADEELARERPDHVQALQVSEEATTRVDELLGAARGATEDFARRHAVARSELARARAAISRVDGYARSHPISLGLMQGDRSRQLHSRLAGIRTGDDDPDALFAAARALAAEADRVYDEMRQSTSSRGSSGGWSSGSSSHRSSFSSGGSSSRSSFSSGGSSSSRSSSSGGGSSRW